MTLHRLLAPTSVAVVGATDRLGSYARTTIENLANAGYAGTVVGVHPHRESVLGVRCVSSLTECGAVDAVVIATPAHTVTDIVSEARHLGCGGAIVYASEFAEAGGLEREAALIGAASGFPVIGPNCNGLVSIASRAPLWGDAVTMPDEPGSIALVTQSGNFGVIALAHRGARDLHTVVSIGNATVVGAADLVHELATVDGVRVIALYLEGDGDGAALSDALSICAQRDVRIVVLKSGRSERGAQAGRAHTAALAGDQRIVESLIREAGGVLVHDTHSLLETARALSRMRRDPRGVALLMSSGADAAVSADLAHDAGTRLTEFSRATCEALTPLLPEGVHIANPLDHTNHVWADTAAVARIAEVVCRDSDVGHLVYVQDEPITLPPSAAAEWDATRRGGVEGAGRAGINAIVACTTPGQEPEGAVSGVWPTLVALAAMQRAEPAPERLREIAATARRTRGQLRQIDEYDAKRLVQQVGIPVPASHVVTTREEAVRAAVDLGGPVALKVVAPGLIHKARVGAIAVNLSERREIAAEAQRLLDLPLGSQTRLLVESMAPPGLEMMVSATAEGLVPALVVGVGGAWAEIVDDVVVIPLPASIDRVTSALRDLRVWPILRTQATHALAQVAWAAALLLCDEGLWLVELNPVIVSATSVMAVDAVIR